MKTLSKFAPFILMLFLLPGRMEAQEKSLVNVSHSPFVKTWGLNMDAVRLTEGFWGDRFWVCRDSMVPSMWKIMDNPEISHCFRNFEIAAGKAEGEHEGPPFHDGDFYKWFESLAAVYLQTGDPAIDSLMDEIIKVIQASQRDDGYIHTPVVIQEANSPGAELEFRDRLDFETYNLGHLMTAASIHYRATGKRSLLDAAVRAGDFLIGFCERAPYELAQNAICPSHYMGVAELYRTTGDERYLELARDLIEIRDMVVDGTDHNQDRIPFRQQTSAIGHAVRANYLYAGVADLVAETGDTSLLGPLESIWKDLVESKLYITGGCGALYDGVSPDGTSYSPPYIQQVHQAYGRPYQLPNITAHNESCANIGSVLWSWRMFLITGDAAYMDLLERTLYNAVLPAVSLDGKRYFYTNPLRVNQDLPYTLRWSKEREEYISRCNCCPPNIVRTLAEVSNYFYSLSEQGLWINLYGGSTLDTRLQDGSSLAVEQVTGYPWDGHVKIEVKKAPSGEFALFLRIPGWAEGAFLSLNGERVHLSLEPGTYTRLNRTWREGDLVELELPLRTRLIQANPLVEETANQVAIQRGPLVYCLESVDVPDSISIFHLAIPAGTRFDEVDISIMGARMTVLEGPVRIVAEPDPANRLYREYTEPESGTVRIRLVPYYAWGNRRKSDMTIWMGVDH